MSYLAGLHRRIGEPVTHEPHEAHAMLAALERHREAIDGKRGHYRVTDEDRLPLLRTARALAAAVPHLVRVEIGGPTEPEAYRLPGGKWVFRYSRLHAEVEQMAQRIENPPSPPAQWSLFAA